MLLRSWWFHCKLPNLLSELLFGSKILQSLPQRRAINIFKSFWSFWNRSYIIIIRRIRIRKQWLLLKLWIATFAGSEAMFADLGHFSYTAIQVPSIIFIYMFIYLPECNFLYTSCHRRLLSLPLFILHLSSHIWVKLLTCQSTIIYTQQVIRLAFMSQFPVMLFPSQNFSKYIVSILLTNSMAQ